MSANEKACSHRFAYSAGLGLVHNPKCNTPANDCAYLRAVSCEGFIGQYNPCHTTFFVYECEVAQ